MTEKTRETFSSLDKSTEVTQHFFPMLFLVHTLYILTKLLALLVSNINISQNAMNLKQTSHCYM